MLLQRPFEALMPTLDGDVLFVLARADAAFTGGDLARLLPHASPDGVRKAAQRLVAHGVVAVEQVGQAYRYSLNRRHLLAAAVVAIARAADALRESVHDHVQGWPRPPELVLLFGSAARGDMRTDSDIDLLVVAAPCDEVDEAAADLAGAVTGWTGNDARIVHLSPQELRDAFAARDSFIMELLTDGQVLWGPERYLQRVRREVAV